MDPNLRLCVVLVERAGFSFQRRAWLLTNLVQTWATSRSSPLPPSYRARAQSVLDSKTTGMGVMLHITYSSLDCHRASIQTVGLIAREWPPHVLLIRCRAQ